MSSTGSVVRSNPAVPANKKREIFKIEEPGKNLFMQLFSTSNTMKFTIKADNKTLKFGLYDYVTTALLNGWGYQNNTPGISLLEHNAPPGDNMLIILYGFKWKSSLIVDAENQDAADRWAIVTVTFERPPSTIVAQEPIPKPDPVM